MLEAHVPDETSQKPFQDSLYGNYCFGCGAWNESGLRIKSRWEGEESVCHFTPESHHAAMPPDVMNGGIIAAVIDCHSVCTAIADAYRRGSREVGEGKVIWYATGSLQVNYRKPTPVGGPITARARITAVNGRKTRLECAVYAYTGEKCADGQVLAVRVPDEWADPKGLLHHLR